MQNSELTEITGEVLQIVYRNDENGYTVFEFSDGNEEITAVGTIPMVNVGEQLCLHGQYKTHPSYGEQFSVEACERYMPSTASSILKYLSSGAVKGIGPVTARQLVEAFQEKTLEVLQNEPDRVAAIKGFSLSKTRKISDELAMMFEIRECMVYLSGFGISASDAVKMWKIWKNKTLKMVKENPYVMCTDGINISFEKADKIASEQDRPFDNICRIRAGIAYILQHNRNNGHTCLPKDKLSETCTSFLSVTRKQADEALEAMIFDNSLICEIIDDKELVFIPSLHRSETYAAARLLMLLLYPAKQIGDIQEKIKKIEQKENIEYAVLQKKAIDAALSKGLLILTGGPGTGKTTTLNGIIKILKDNGEKVFLAAPTGRAAKRMSELTGCEAKTIHRLLEVAWDASDRPIFKRNEKNLLNCDALILDELSMVDAQLFESVMRALPMGCRLILVGDSDQLPSVGAGNVLGDLISSGVVPVVSLTEIFRQSMESLIVMNAHKIISGEMPDFNQKDKDFFLLTYNRQEDISNTIVDLYKTRLPKSYGFSPFDDIQVLSPTRKGMLGTYELNKMLQNAINPHDKFKKEININGVIFREGDKIMQIRNNYNITWEKDDGTSGDGIFNGDVGILSEINKSNQSLKIRFEDKTAIYDGESLNELELAYATTVHKSQGNEFEAVIMPMYYGAPQLYYRNLLYTAVTRAKKLLILVGNAYTVERMVQNNRRTKRYSALKDFLQR
ncbi:MAG: ATP-dependent RecD-like DNA helicase [Bacillota bacterium]|nr:ATP-dependent RecD-like DNA helicase [Bacillota bacterium]